MVDSKMFGGNAQHTNLYAIDPQNLNFVKWGPLSVDDIPAAPAVYGPPLISNNNVVYIPVKKTPSATTLGADNFTIKVIDGSTGVLNYEITGNEYVAPPYSILPPYGPAITQQGAFVRLWYPGPGGTVWYVDDADNTVGHAAPVQVCFYTSMVNYLANKADLDGRIFVNTMMITDSTGAVLFGYKNANPLAPAIIPDQPMIDGVVRIGYNLAVTYITVRDMTGDVFITRGQQGYALTLNNDETVVYALGKATSTDFYCYLIGMTNTDVPGEALKPIYKVVTGTLRDPRNVFNPVGILDGDPATTPMVGPDGDVYLGVAANPSTSRNWLLHFSGDLGTTKLPGNSSCNPSVVPANLVPSYNGLSTYLILTTLRESLDFSFVTVGGSGATGVNKLALLDPNAPGQRSRYDSDNNQVCMREVLTAIATTPNIAELSSPFSDGAVIEFCSDAMPTSTVRGVGFSINNDTRVYRWNMVTHLLDQVTDMLYTDVIPNVPVAPAAIGPDGALYAVVAGLLFCIGDDNAGSGTLTATSNTTMRSAITGPITLTVTATQGGSPLAGNITFTNKRQFIDPLTGFLTDYPDTALGSAALVNGVANLTTGVLPFDHHEASNWETQNFVTAVHDATGLQVQMAQKVHQFSTITTVTATPNPAFTGQTVTIAALVTGIGSAGYPFPSEYVTFFDPTPVIGRTGVFTNSPATFARATLTSNTLAAGTHTFTCTYDSDIWYADGTGSGGGVITSKDVVIVLTSDLNPSNLGDDVTFTATVTSVSAPGIPTGRVTFSDNGEELATVTLDANGQAVLRTCNLDIGSHLIEAVFVGTNGWGNASTSIIQVVKAVVVEYCH